MASGKGKGAAPAARGGRIWRALSLWGLAFGCIIGWGSFVMPGTTFLPGSGPVGTIAGMLLATAAMAVAALNYAHLAESSGESGSYELIKQTLGIDHGFLAAWCLVLAYLSLLWANVTAFALVGRYLLGGVFQWGFHYVVGGYDVYLGEVLLAVAIQLVFGLLAAHADWLASTLRTIVACGIVAAVAALCAGTAGHVDLAALMSPPFSPAAGAGPLHQVLSVAVLAPWMFVGFETVYQEPADDGRSSRDRTWAAVLAIAAGALTYIALMLVAVSGTPEQYASWVDYVAGLGSLHGFEGMPVLYNAHSALGPVGVGLLAAAILCTLSTSVLGFYRASARIVQAIAADGLLPAQLAEEERGVPRNAILAIMVVSLPISLLGRTAVGWNADVSTLSVAIVYAYISLCAFYTAGKPGQRGASVLGAVGFVTSIAIFFMLLVPNFFFESALATESYFMLAAWSLLGILYYWWVYSHDEDHRFGESPVMWIMLLFLLLFSVIEWSRLDAERQLAEIGCPVFEDGEHILAVGSLFQIGAVVLALVIMFNLFLIMLKRERELDRKTIAAEARAQATTSFLFNMSHDMRTPMNAVIGFTGLALQEDDPRQVHEYLEKIQTSGEHLLELINDVLEMSRVESGKVELVEEPVDLLAVLEGLRTIIGSQAEEKRQRLVIEAGDVTDPVVYGDKLRLNQILLNLVSNAIKYTPEGGSIEVRLAQTGPEEDGMAPYRLTVRDDGIGMEAEFAERVFDAFERERTSTVSGIQGTGLGLAITKQLAELMGGSISVRTAPGRGSTFTVEVPLAVCHEAVPAAAPAGEPVAEEPAEEPAEERQLRMLLVDDIELNREIANAILEMSGFLVEEACDGQEAVDAIVGHEPGYFDAVLMDIQMPVMDGYEATRAIRALPDEGRSRIPIIAVTANAFEEDRQAAFEAGMNAHVAKPIDPDELVSTLEGLIG